MSATCTFIPMLSSQLTRGPRPLKPLPDRPVGFGAQCAFLSGVSGPDGISQVPRNHEHVCTLEWAFSPVSLSICGYYVEQTVDHWLMWNHVYDDNHDFWEWSLFAFSSYSKMDKRTASLYLLLDGFSASRKSLGLNKFNWVSDEGVLDKAELATIGDIVWGD